MANYPATLPSTTPATHGAVNDEVVAIATELGTDSAGSYTDVLARMVAASQIGPPRGMKYVTGRYYDNSVGNSVVGVAFAANIMRLAPFWCSEDKTFDRIGISVTTAAAAASNAYLGIYNADGTSGAPSSLLLSAGTVLTDAVGSVEITISQSLSGSKWYWLAYLPSAAPTVRCVGPTVAVHLGSTALTTISPETELGYSTSHAGGLPTPLTFASFTYSANGPPSIKLRAT